MKSAIEELILFNPEFPNNITHSQNYWKLAHENSEIFNKLKEKLGKEELDMVRKLIDNQLAMEAEAVDAYSVKGFKTGLKLFAECL